ncbi:unnamed protein product, partial [Prorocentrum cordatum]
QEHRAPPQRKGFLLQGPDCSHHPLFAAPEFRPSPAVRCLGGALTPPRPPGPRGGRAPCPAERLLKGGGRHAGVAPRLAAVGTSSVTRRVRLGGQVPRPPQVVRKT